MRIILVFFDAYGDKTGPGFSLGVTYTTKYTAADGSEKNKSEWLQATAKDIVKAENDSIVDEDGNITVRFKSADEPLQVDVVFKYADHIPGSDGAGGKYYITDDIYADFSDGNGNRAQNIQYVNFYIPIITYDDYAQTGNQSYEGAVYLYDTDEVADDIQATGYLNVNYNGLGTPSISSGNNGSTYDSYNFTMPKVYSYLYSNSSNYRGNYYWMEFAPNIENSYNALYYISNKSFLQGRGDNQLKTTGVNGKQATFTSDNANTCLRGMVGSDDWDYIGTVSVAQVQGDDNLVSNSCFAKSGGTNNSSATDAKLQYQLKQVFKNYSSDGQLVVYRSQSKHSYGEYMYLIIDPATVKTAQTCYNNGWNEYIDTTDGKAKPGKWKIHVFNAPCSTLYASMYQVPGVVYSNDQNSSGSIKDQVTCGIYGDNNRTESNQAFYSMGRYPAGYMNARWVDDETIFWEFTVDVTNYPEWYMGSLCINAGNNQAVAQNGSVKMDGQTFDTSLMYVRIPNKYNVNDGTWEEVNGTVSSGMRFWGTEITDMNGASTIVSGYSDKTARYNFSQNNGWYKYRYSTSGAQNITVGFFSKVTGAATDGREYACEAEYMIKAGDASRLSTSDGQFPNSVHNGNLIQYPFKIKAQAKTAVPYMYKNGIIADDGSDTKKLTMDWTIGFSNIFPFSYAGVISGPLLNGGRCAHITKMFSSGFSITEMNNGGGCGPIPYEDLSEESGYSGDTSWEKYQNGRWVKMSKSNLWEPEKAAVYRKILTESGTNTEKNPLALYVYYAGNMADSINSKLANELFAVGAYPGDKTFYDSVAVEYRGLNHAYSGSPNNGYYNSCSIGDLKYTTVFDSEGFLADVAANGDGAYVDVALNNSASCGMWAKAGREPLTEKVSRRISALLAIEKKVKLEQIPTPINGTVSQYELKVSNGFSAAEKIEVEDYLTGFANVCRTADRTNGEVMANGSFTAEENPAALKELTQSLSLTDITIKAALPGKSVETIYQNGKFSASWSTSEFILKDAEGYTSEKTGSLFRADFKKTSGTIPAGTDFVISYKMALDMDGEQAFRASSYYLGEGLQILNAAEALRSYTSAAAQKAKARAGADKKLLAVDSGAVGGAFLTKDVLKKNMTSNGTDGGHSEWLYSAYTGSMGKDEYLSLSLSDALRYEIEKMTFTDKISGKTVKLENIDDPTEREQIALLLEHLIEKHAKYSNIKLYYTDMEPGGAADLSEADLLYDFSHTFAFSGGTAVTGGKITDGRLTEVMLGETPSESKTEITAKNIHLTLTGHTAGLMKDAQTGELTHSHIGFDVSAEGLAREKYLAVRYDVDIDWAGVQSEVQQIFGNYSINGGLVNSVTDGYGDKVDASGNVVKIDEATLQKNLRSTNKKDGSANWQIVANTGSLGGEVLRLTDTVTAAAATDERLKNAIEKATYIDPETVSVWQGNGTAVYYNGVYDKNRAEWNTDTLKIQIDGNHLEIVVQNTEQYKVLAKNQNYSVSYTTKLDKNKFIQNGGLATDSYTLLNTAGLSCGNLNLTDSNEGDFAPNVPLEVTKKVENTNGNLTEWTASASTGAAARTDFVLTDTVKATDDKAQSAIAIEDMRIVITDKEGNASEYALADLPEGVSLTKKDGSELKLGEVGTDGFKLTFAEIDAQTKVTVYYTTRVDRELYLENGGTDNALVVLKNAFHAECADGSFADTGRTGTAKINKLLAKAGNILNETSKDGNPILGWNVRVDLTQKFSSEYLGKMSEVTISDAINPVLRLVNDSVAVKAGSQTVPFEAETEGNTLKITLKNPAFYPNVTVSFKTECLYSVDGLVNAIDLKIDGKSAQQAVSPDVGKIHANGQSGTIQSGMKTPLFTPEAWKYVNHELCTADGRYSFRLVATDETGKPLSGEEAYEDTATNDAGGKITFATIGYKEAGTYYYRIQEQGSNIKDTRKFLIAVEVVKLGGNGGYLVESSVVSPQNYEQVMFDNTDEAKTTSISVTKVWDDDDNALGIRPEHIIVHLLKGGKPYDNLAVTLREENNWQHTWSDLPLAGGDYTVIEEKVPAGYESKSEISEKGVIITNTLDMSSLTIRKTVVRGDTDKEFTFTVTLTDREGNALTGAFPYDGSKTGTVASGESVKLKSGEFVTIGALPEGTLYQVIEEESGKDGYKTTASVDKGVIDRKNIAFADFVNKKDTNIPPVPEQPENPDKPDIPDVPDKPDVPDTPETPDNPSVPDSPADNVPQEPQTTIVNDNPDVDDNSVPETPAKDIVPQTGDTSQAALAGGMMIVSALVLIILRRRSKFN